MSRPPGPPERAVGRLYLVALAHLDSQWRWTIRDTIREFLPATLTENLRRFERYPGYVLSFEGAFRYQLIEEYDPGGFARLCEAVAQGRWYPAGAMLDAPDVNIPDPESLVRHILYGNGFFRRRLGRESHDLLLPDGFGFGWALPSIAAHCGLRGFSTSKHVKWLAPAPLPFRIGRWRGPDGGTIVAALAPGGYGEPLRCDPGSSPPWTTEIERLHRATGVAVGFGYFGVGDRGGAPDEGSLAHLERAIRSHGAIEVVTGPSDRIFRELSASDVERLPEHRSEILLPTHGTGCWTAQSAMKRWNRLNESLAAAAETAAVAAHHLGAMAYPRETLQRAWIRFLWHQMHDDLTGTSIPAAYVLSARDEAIAANELREVLRAAVGAVARGLERPDRGLPLVVFNPLPFPRQDLVEAEVSWSGEPPAALVVETPAGDELPAQPLAVRAGRLRFVARVPVAAASFTVFLLHAAAPRALGGSELAVSETVLENERLRVELGSGGEVVQIHDKQLGRDLLASPLRLELLTDRSRRWPAWEIRWPDICAPPREVVRGSRPPRVVERGPVRVAVEIDGAAAGSRFRRRLSLAAGDAGDRLEIDLAVDWRSHGRLLKAAFHLATPEPVATFDLGWGAIERGVNRREKYEVPAQRWADLTAADGSWGVAVLDDCRYGWDRPAADVLRLSLLRSPAVGRRFRHQGRQDFGRHRLRIALAPHAGGWQQGDVVGRAARLQQPLLAFRAPAAMGGELGRSFSLLDLSPSPIALRALKLAEESEEVVVRLQESAGQAAPGARLRWSGGLAAAREIDGQERPRGAARLAAGALAIDFTAFSPRAFALRPATPEVAVASARCSPLDVPFDLEATSFHGARRTGDADGSGRTLPGELFPSEVVCGGVLFRLGPAVAGAANCLLCRGQELVLPSDAGRRVELLAAAVGGARRTRFCAGRQSVEVTVPDLFDPPAPRRPSRWVGRLLPRRVRPAPVAWLATHLHDRRLRDLPYAFAALYRCGFDLPTDAESLALPDRPELRIFAITLVDGGGHDVELATPWDDELLPLS